MQTPLWYKGQGGCGVGTLQPDRTGGSRSALLLGGMIGAGGVAGHGADQGQQLLFLQGRQHRRRGERGSGCSRPALAPCALLPCLCQKQISPVPRRAKLPRVISPINPVSIRVMRLL
ncbi:hypothetical protein SAMN04244548_04927 [Paracoccus pantotrophus]|nr:hypothetical protein SAMN04244548_04927 [Paracoccus pantotrophus]